MAENFQYDVFLSHSDKDKAVVRPLAERLRTFFSQPSTLNCQPARDPLNKDRHFIPLRLDNAPIKGSLAQLLYIHWCPQNCGHLPLMQADGGQFGIIKFIDYTADKARTLFASPACKESCWRSTPHSASWRTIPACRLDVGKTGHAHLIHTRWADRLTEACRCERSIAVARGIGNLCEVKAWAKKAKQG